VRFTEINVLGVYVAPMSLMMVAACAGLRPGSDYCGMSGIWANRSFFREIFLAPSATGWSRPG
jgi:hypothetical protein